MDRGQAAPHHEFLQSPAGERDQVANVAKHVRPPDIPCSCASELRTGCVWVKEIPTFMAHLSSSVCIAAADSAMDNM
jgi:hypothetical protein